METVKTDVVVVGFGGAGGAAAIAAHDNGASVIILEKMSKPGGNTRVSAGQMVMPKYSQDSGRFAEYLKAICHNTTEPEIIDAFVEGLMELPDWFQKMGSELIHFIRPHLSYSFHAPNPTRLGVPLAESLELGTRCIPETEAWPGFAGGARLFELLAKQVELRGIKVMLSTRAKELVKNQRGEIVGVIAESEANDILIRAKRGVILACGGFENDEALKRDNLEPKPLSFMGSPGNTGDGIRMAQKVGAALWHMSRQSTPLGVRPPGFETALLVNLLAPGYIYVDKHGRRFASEPKIECHDFWRPCSYFDEVQHYEYPRVPFYVIFDEEVRRSGPVTLGLCGYALVEKKYEWSLDNSAEIAKGWLIRARSISELARRTSMEAQTLESTMAKYNGYCTAGYDADFGRPKETLKAIEGPPYYAMQVEPSLVNTQGGARRDKKARVLDPDGKPIPRLYAAGEFGSIWGFLYESAGNVPEAIVFGRIAGKNAALSPAVEP